VSNRSAAADPAVFPVRARLDLIFEDKVKAMPDDPRNSPLWPADNSAVNAHVNLLQGIINRLAGNSASCKTWCLTLVGALFSLAGAAHVPGIITFALVPVVIFGFMDTMYLAQEKAYRDLYACIVSAIRGGAYAPVNAYEARAPLKWRLVGEAFASWSIWPVYLGLIAAYLVAHFAGWLTALTATSK
jgi:hypothetical protein